jgi:hypothetical protein
MAARGLVAILARLVVVFVLPRAEAFGSTPPEWGTRTPFTFAVSGGGFRSMTAGMAFSRALSEAFEEVAGMTGWDDITHLSGNSGGQWFATQFVFGQDWFEELTRTRSMLGSKSITVLLAQWAEGYQENVRDVNLPPFEPNECIVDLGFVDFDVSLFVKGFVDVLTFIDFPVRPFTSPLRHRRMPLHPIPHPPPSLTLLPA